MLLEDSADCRHMECLLKVGTKKRFKFQCTDGAAKRLSLLKAEEEDSNTSFAVRKVRSINNYLILFDSSVKFCFLKVVATHSPPLSHPHLPRAPSAPHYPDRRDGLRREPRIGHLVGFHEADCILEV